MEVVHENPELRPPKVVATTLPRELARRLEQTEVTLAAYLPAP